MNISVLGGGSWATAISKELSKNHNIFMYVRDELNAKSINDNHQNIKYLKGNILPENIKAYTNIEDVLHNKYIINAIPTQKIRSMLEEYSEKFSKDSIIINLSKGIEMDTYLRISEIFKEFLPENKFVALSGPSHAEEVIKGVPTSLVAASEDFNIAKEIQNIMISESLRVYTNEDLIGVEFGGAVKNVLAIGVGILDGKKFGDNSRAAVITRGIHEMTRFCIAMGGDRTTLYGLAGIGDLIVTATSQHSRNRKAGELIGEGHTIDSLEKDIGMVVEGIPTCKALYEISKKKDIYMPLTNIIYNILYKNMDVSTAVEILMSKSGKNEFEF